jgi:hypothetical protein
MRWRETPEEAGGELALTNLRGMAELQTLAARDDFLDLLWGDNEQAPAEQTSAHDKRVRFSCLPLDDGFDKADAATGRVYAKPFGMREPVAPAVAGDHAHRDAPFPVCPRCCERGA